MKKIAIVNQRYGLEVNGGSEYYTRLIANKLNEIYDVEILTTTALDYDTWENHYTEGLQLVDGIKVRRFVVNRKRNMIRFRIVNKLLQLTKKPSMRLELKWVDEQGPLSKDLVKYIRDYKDDYDIFIFVTYLYYHTIKGLPEVAEKSILIPTAHDEPYIYMNIYKDIFTLSKGIIYLTEEEKNLVQAIFHNEDIIHDVIGIGIDVPSKVSEDEFRDKFRIKEQYIVYVGRVDLGKNCDEMIEYFIKYKNQNSDSNLKLVIMGKSIMDIPKHPDIIYLGFVSEEDKYNGISGARALILPSEYESLSISVLEAMSLSTPVLVNGKCAVLKGHCEKSKGGQYYNDYLEFKDKLNELLTSDNNYMEMCENAKNYIEATYQWDTIMKRFEQLLLKI